MEKHEQRELEILIAIRNHPKTPIDEFCKIFDCSWPEYREVMSDLYDDGLFIISSHEIIAGLNRLELTGNGKRRESELLLERSTNLSKLISRPAPQNSAGFYQDKLVGNPGF